MQYARKLKIGKNVKTIGANAFTGIYKKATIKVPKSKVKTYQKMLKTKGIDNTVKVKK
ncbi:MAG: hypothetical protein IJA36_00130 [Lachnospiraceae bacterium]|nr:hypothetical protein [Lachnospiraceae bacterium]